MKLIKACLLGMNYSAEDILTQESANSIDELRFSEISDYDYMDIGLINADTNKLIYSIDNVHGHPESVIEGYLKALDDTNVDYSIIEKVVDSNTLD